jgi:hypothetical protein
LALAGPRGTGAVFPGSGRWAKDDLPATGMDLRRTYRTIAADLGVDELIAHFLMGHAPDGVSRRYVSKLILQNGAGMRDAQGRIRHRISELLRG